MRSNWGSWGSLAWIKDSGVTLSISTTVWNENVAGGGQSHMIVIISPSFGLQEHSESGKKVKEENISANFYEIYT